MAALTLKGGDKLTSYLKQLSAKIAKAGSVEVGWYDGATYPGVNGPLISMVAAIQEYGAPKAKIPPRPFLRPTVKEGETTWGPALAKYLEATDYDTAKALGLLGNHIRDEIQANIIKVTDPPLSDITIMLRSMRQKDTNLIVTGATVGQAAAKVKAGELPGAVSTKPLVDSGLMLRSVDFQVLK